MANKECWNRINPSKKHTSWRTNCRHTSMPPRRNLKQLIKTISAQESLSNSKTNSKKLPTGFTMLTWRHLITICSPKDKTLIRYWSQYWQKYRATKSSPRSSRSRRKRLWSAPGGWEATKGNMPIFLWEIARQQWCKLINSTSTLKTLSTYRTKHQNPSLSWLQSTKSRTNWTLWRKMWR